MATYITCLSELTHLNLGEIVFYRPDVVDLPGSCSDDNLDLLVRQYFEIGMLIPDHLSKHLGKRNGQINSTDIQEIRSEFANQVIKSFDKRFEEKVQYSNHGNFDYNWHSNPYKAYILGRFPDLPEDKTLLLHYMPCPDMIQLAYNFAGNMENNVATELREDIIEKFWNME